MSRLEKAIITGVDSKRNELTDLVMKLIRIPTINPPGEKYEEFVKFVSQWLSDAGVKTQIIEVPREKLGELVPYGRGLPRFSLVGRVHGSEGKPILCFDGHIDVVPPTSGANRDLFDPVLEDGRIYGRGACDMKGGIAGIMMAAKVLVDNGFKPRGDLMILLTPDEEKTSGGGINYIINEGLLKADYAIVAEGTEEGVSGMVIGQKGGVHGYIVTYGKAAHGATPYKGVNAFEKLVDVAYAIKTRLKPKLESRVSKYDFASEVEKHPTIMIGGVLESSGDNTIVPDKCSMSVDRRVLPDESIEEAEREIINFLKELQREDPELKVEFKRRVLSDLYYLSPETKICQVVGRDVKRATGQNPTFTVSSGWCETVKFFKRGIQAVTYGPKNRGAHAVDEHVAVDDLIAVTKVYALSAMDLLS